MATNNMALDTNLTLAREIMELVHHMRECNEKLAEKKAIMDGMVDGTNYTMLETMVGIAPNANGIGAPNGSGAALLYLVANTRDAFANSPVIQQFCTWITPKA